MISHVVKAHQSSIHRKGLCQFHVILTGLFSSRLYIRGFDLGQARHTPRDLLALYLSDCRDVLRASRPPGERQSRQRGGRRAFRERLKGAASASA